MNPLLGVLAVSGVLTGAVRTEVRTRQVQDRGAEGADLETAPALALLLRGKTLDFGLTYAPRLTVIDLASSASKLTVLHRGVFGGRWRKRGVELTIDEDVSYGSEDFASLVDMTLERPGAGDAPTPAEPRVESLPTARIIEFFSTRTALAAALVPARRWTLRTAAAFVASGGVDTASQQSMPLQKGPEVEGRATFMATRKDRFGSAVGAQYAMFSAGDRVGPATLVVDATGFWTRQISRRFETELGAGLAGVYSTGPSLTAVAAPDEGRADVEGRSGVHPAATARLTWRAVRDRGAQIDLELVGQLAPSADRTTGLVEQRGQGELRVSWLPTPALRFAASSGFTQSVDTSLPTATTLVRGEILASFKAHPTVSLEAGMRGAFQEQAATTTTPWGAFFAVTLSSPPSWGMLSSVPNARPPARTAP